MADASIAKIEVSAPDIATQYRDVAKMIELRWPDIHNGLIECADKIDSAIENGNNWINKAVARQDAEEAAKVESERLAKLAEEERADNG